MPNISSDVLTFPPSLHFSLPSPSLSPPESILASYLEEGEAYPEAVEGVDGAMGLLLSAPPEDGPKVRRERGRGRWG
jgi:hypothetical protein